MAPLGASLGSGLNAGWYNTAKTHGLGRFDVTGIHFIGFPNEAKKFNPSNNLNYLVVENNESIPTFVEEYKYTNWSYRPSWKLSICI